MDRSGAATGTAEPGRTLDEHPAELRLDEDADGERLRVDDEEGQACCGHHREREGAMRPWAAAARYRGRCRFQVPWKAPLPGSRGRRRYWGSGSGNGDTSTTPKIWVVHQEDAFLGSLSPPA